MPVQFENRKGKTYYLHQGRTKTGAHANQSNTPLVCFQDGFMVPRILHIDMDAFYASVEQADHPELIGKPVIIGASHRGVVAAASYEARKFKVRSAMPVFEAKRLCPNGVFLPVRRRRYQEVSHQVMQILETVSPLVEQVSVDEAFIDITGTESLHGPETAFIRKIKEAIKQSFEGLLERLSDDLHPFD